MPGTEALAVPGGEVPSLIGPALRLVAALAVFLFAAYVFVKWRKRFVSEKRSLEVLERVGLTRGASLVLVRAGGQRLLVGVSPDGVRLLKSLPALAPEPAPVTFASTLEAVEAVSVPSQKSVGYFGEAAAVLARRADDGIPGVFRGGPTPPAPPMDSEIGDGLLTRDTSQVSR